MGDALERVNTNSFNIVFRTNTMKKYMEPEDKRYRKRSATLSVWAYAMANVVAYAIVCLSARSAS